jgi:hypothetical protein
LAAPLDDLSKTLCFRRVMQAEPPAVPD